MNELAEKPIETKPIWESKRFWLTVFATVVSPVISQAIPAYALFVAENHEVFWSVIGALFGGASLGENKRPIAIVEPIKGLFGRPR